MRRDEVLLGDHPIRRADDTYLKRSALEVGAEGFASRSDDIRLSDEP
jgi:hypothetical protein